MAFTMDAGARLSIGVSIAPGAIAFTRTPRPHDLLGDGTGEPKHASLGSGVVGEAGLAHHPRRRGDGDDGARLPGQHLPQRGTDDVEGALEVD